MKKHLMGLMAVLMVLAFVTAVFAVSDTLVLKSPTKGDVKFTHKKHTDALAGKCVDCHHTTKAGGTPEKCTNCHDQATGAKGGGLNAKAAFHKQCAGCHKTMAKGPVLGKCNECHGA